MLFEPPREMLLMDYLSELLQQVVLSTTYFLVRSVSTRVLQQPCTVIELPFDKDCLVM